MSGSIRDLVPWTGDARPSGWTGDLVFFATALIVCALTSASCQGIDTSSQDQGTGDFDTDLPSLSLPSDDFVENAGQIEHPEIDLFHTSAGVRVGFGPSVVWIVAADSRPDPVSVNPTAPSPEPRTARGTTLRLSFEGSRTVSPEGRQQRSYRTHYFVGDESRWRSHVRSFGEVVYPSLYDGIDLVYEPSAQGPKYHFDVAPGADPADIVMHYEGATSVTIDEAGHVAVNTELGPLEDDAPVAYDGTGANVECRFAPRGELSVGFDCPDWDGRTSLTIDPILASTFLGGGESEFVRDVAVDSQGRAWLAGETSSLDFPTTPGAFSETFHLGEYDAFLACLSGDTGELLNATYFGGADGDSGFGVAIGPGGDVFTTGLTRSADFPITQNSVATPSESHEDAFVARLSPDGSELLYATALAGFESDGDTRALAMDVDTAGVAYVTGLTLATNFPVTPGAFGERLDQSGAEAFAMAVSPTGDARIFSTFLGRGVGSTSWDMAVGPNAAYITGTRFDLETLFDGWAIGLTLDGTALDWDVRFEGVGMDFSQAIAVDALGQTWVGGHTNSGDFPDLGSALDSPLGQEDLFVAGIDTSGELFYTARLGGTSRDFGFGLDVDEDGFVTIAGATTSDDFPVTTDAGYAGGRDVVIAVIDPAADVLVEASYLGGPSAETPTTVVSGPLGTVIVGNTASEAYPVTADAFQTTPGGQSDAFITLVSAPSEPPNPGNELELVVPADVTVQCSDSKDPDATGHAIVVGGCGEPTPTFSDQTEAGACDGERTVFRTFTVTDDCGNSLSATQVITVIDTTAPTLTVPTSASLTCRDSTDPNQTGTATAVDACDQQPVVTFDDVLSSDPVCPVIEETVRTWSATDACGNTSTGVQTLAVTDNRAPSIICPAPIRVEATSSAGAEVEVVPDAVGDACDTSPTITSDAPDVFPLGTTEVTLFAADDCAQVASCTTQVTVTCLAPTSVDFEAWPAGTVIDDQVPGLTVSALNGHDRHPDLAIVFDSDAPTGGDPDLATPGYGGGNDESLGNLLIIAEDDRDDDGDGLIDDPDDEARGGSISFAFDEPANLRLLTLVDIEESGGIIELIDGQETVFTGVIPSTTDNGVQHLDLSQAPQNVSRVVVRLPGSGGVDNLVFCSGGACCGTAPPGDAVLVEAVTD